MTGGIRRGGARWAFAFVLGVTLGAPLSMGPRPPAARARPTPDAARLAVVTTALEELRVEDAVAAAEALVRTHPNDPGVLARLAAVRFHQGRYDEAARTLERALGGTSPSPEERFLLELFQSTREATVDFVNDRGPEGRVAVLHPPGDDQVLVPWAEEALRRAEDVLAPLLGVRVPGPLRLEIYPSPRALAAVSTLTVDEIERTGTIALSKWDRLMITSPRALPRGYPWLDTVVHELVHLLLSRATRDRAPVWLQEGVAKLLERRWRDDGSRDAGDDGAFPYLDPASEGLLFEALGDDGLIPFDDLHPSIARLPSQRDAALAFAQVATFVGTYVDRYGPDALRSAFDRIADGEDARQALAREAGTSFRGLESRWRATLEAHRAALGAGAAEDRPDVRPLRFGPPPSRADEAEEVDVASARRHLRLGDLLWDRGRQRAAEAEYAKAHEADPDDPIVGSRLGHAALAAGHPDRAVAALAPLVDRHPHHAPLFALLGRARVELGDSEGATDAFVGAIRLNPFDPGPHCGLAEAATDPTLRSRGSSACRTLRTR